MAATERSTYVPAEGVLDGSRPHCATCGAAYRLHLQRGTERWCPQAWRPDTLEAAQAALERATAAGDEAAVFVARGNLQRLQGRRPASDPRAHWPVDHEAGE